MAAEATAAMAMTVIRASRPAFRRPHDAAAFAVHASFLAAGFSLVAAGEAAFADPPPSGDEEVGIDGWDQIEGRYGFVYLMVDKKGRKSRVLVKGIAVEDLLVVDAVDLNASCQTEPLNLQINVKDSISDTVNAQRNYADAYKDFDGMIKAVNSSFLAKFCTDETEGGKGADSESTSGALRSEIPESSSVEPAAGIHDTPEGFLYPPVPSYGYSDLYPGVPAGVFPGRGAGRGGGMHVGPDHPMFHPYIRPTPPGNLIGSIPPGSRYDPIGPPDVPGFEPSAFARRPRRPGGINPDIHPDIQHFPRGGPDFI